MSEITPGPWEVDSKNGELRDIMTAYPLAGYPINGLGAREMVATAYPMNCATDRIEAAFANARLIAAAPDLLDVLKRLSNFEFSHQGVAEGPLATILHQANDAIAKAEGRS